MTKAKTLVKSTKPPKAAKPDFPVSVSAHGLSLYEIEGKPYAMDVEYGTWSGLKNPDTVRLRIRNNWNELQTYGPIFLVKKMIELGKGAEREVETYYLNEEHTLLLTMLGRTEKSAEFRKLLIEVFKAWRDGRLVATPKAVETAPAVAEDPRPTSPQIGWPQHASHEGSLFLLSGTPAAVPSGFAEIIAKDERFGASRRSSTSR